MNFQITPPSISHIRAKRVIEKLNTSNPNGNITLFATGRTGSGKTTLGNRLLGIDYFLSTGHQDCTKEVNLVEFPIGLRYFDLPGVCSDDKLENLNRVSLGLEQVDDFPIVQTLTLAQFKEGETPHEKNLNIEEFNTLLFQADLVFYLIAPDKQFGRCDMKYLRDLLKTHSKVIYVLNLFVNKQNQDIYMATEPNIFDVMTKITKVHTSVLGYTTKPVIVGVNCWTGEGISDLVSRSHELLGREKGTLLEELITYQQYHTPIHYQSEVTTELLRLYAYVAYQKPDGTYSCDQTLHKATHTLIDFISNLKKNATQNEYFVAQQIGDMADSVYNQILSNSNQAQIETNIDDDGYISQGLSIIGATIEYINTQITPPFFEAQSKAIQFKQNEIEKLENRVDFLKSELAKLSGNIEKNIEKYNSLDRETDNSASEINRAREKQNSRVESYSSLQEEISVRVNNFNSRQERWKNRLDNYNYAVDRINSGRVRPTQSTLDSLESDADSLRREQDSIENDRIYLASLIESLEEKEQKFKEKEKSLQKKIDRHNRNISTLRNIGNAIRAKLKQDSEYKQAAEDEIGFYVSAVQAFEAEFDSIDESLNSRIEIINERIDTVRQYFLDADDTEKTLSSSISAEEVMNCIAEMNSFIDEISLFHEKLEASMTKLILNKLAGDVCCRATIHYFDDTGEFGYKGSTHNHFHHDGIAFLLAATLSLTTNAHDRFQEFYDHTTDKLKSLNIHTKQSEHEVLHSLNSNMSSLFNDEFREFVQSLAQ